MKTITTDLSKLLTNIYGTPIAASSTMLGSDIEKTYNISLKDALLIIAETFGVRNLRANSFNGALSMTVTQIEKRMAPLISGERRSFGMPTKVSVPLTMSFREG